LENRGVDERIILSWIFRKQDGAMDWIDVVQDRDRWWALVNAVMNLRALQNVGNLWLAENRLASQERLCSMEYVSK